MSDDNKHTAEEEFAFHDTHLSLSGHRFMGRRRISAMNLEDGGQRAEARAPLG